MLPFMGYFCFFIIKITNCFLIFWCFFLKMLLLPLKWCWKVFRRQTVSTFQGCLSYFTTKIFFWKSTLVKKHSVESPMSQVMSKEIESTAIKHKSNNIYSIFFSLIYFLNNIFYNVFKKYNGSVMLKK